MEFKKKESASEVDAQKNKAQREMTQAQLADIYFSSPDKVKKSDYPTVIKVSEKAGPASAISWAVTIATVVIAVFVLISGRRVFVDIRVMDERTALLSATPRLPDRANEASAESSESPALISKQRAAMHLGDKVDLKDFLFEGAAKLKSSKDRVSLTLINSSVAPFARAILHFDSPMNMAGAKIIFYAKGVRGGENVAFAVKDKENVSAFSKNKIYPFPGGLTTDWQRAEIPMFSAAKDFDVKAITSMRFEFGSKDTDNKPGDTIFVKDLQAVPL